MISVVALIKKMGLMRQELSDDEIALNTSTRHITDIHITTSLTQKDNLISKRGT